MIQLVRPNLGNPIILSSRELKRFEITVAYKKDWFNDKEEREEDVPYISVAEIKEVLRKNPPRLTLNNLNIPLKIIKISGYLRHPAFRGNYSQVRHPLTSAQQQYHIGFRWEAKAEVGIGQADLNKLKRNADLPKLFNLTWQGHGGTNSHAVYVHETLKKSSDFTILHITDTHIARRSDLIPEILSQVRNKAECERLKDAYTNFNDHLRTFIKNANARLKKKEDIIVVLTGDILDYYFDGYWNGKFVCKHNGWPDRRKEIAGSSWNSNALKFREIITGSDGKGEALQCPIFTITGNHDYYANEILMNFKFGASVPIPIVSWFIDGIDSRNDYRAFGMSQSMGREYDFWAFPRINGKDHSIPPGIRIPDSIGIRKTFKEQGLNKWQASLVDSWGDKSYWLIKPKSWILSEYLCKISYDIDFQLNIGNCHILCLNTGHDIYPSKGELISPDKDSTKDFKKGGPHGRGITAQHVNLLKKALKTDQEKLVFVFTHSPLIGIENAETAGIDCLYEENLKKRPAETRRKAKKWLAKLYEKSWAVLRTKGGFVFDDRGFFKQGTAAPFLNFFSAEGKSNNFMDAICRTPNQSTNQPVLVFSGHTHKVHEFRIEKIRANDHRNFYFYIDDYSNRYFKKTGRAYQILLRYGFLKAKSPLLFTSGALKSKNPQYREIIVRGLSIASLEMKAIKNIKKTGNFTPGCSLITLRAHNGQYVCAEGGGKRDLTANRNRVGEWEIFEMAKLENGHIALKACNGKFVRAKKGGGGRLLPDKTWIQSHETFLMVGRGKNKIALRSHNGKYVCAEGGGGRQLVANRNTARQWETFRIAQINMAPSSPKQISPKNGITYKREKPYITLKWENVRGALSYTIEVNLKKGTRWQLITLRDIKSTHYIIINTRIIREARWRVWAVDTDEKKGPKSAWWGWKVRAVL